uniref:Centrosomal protein of 19 kDa n=2 Tax=Hirondellea gigas TaxID=1518452 RepID=A0A6A7FS32_9CRUS
MASPSDTSINEDENAITPLRIGVRCKPATLTLLYRAPGGMTRLRLMPVRGLAAYGPLALPLAQIRQRHNKYLQQVPDIRLEKLLRLLQEVSCGRELEEAARALTKEYTIDPNQDLNKLHDADLAKKKKIMDSSFSHHQVLPDDPGYKYDQRLEFDSEKVEAAGWDSSDELWE